MILLNLQGEVVARLPGFSIDNPSDRPGFVLLRRGRDVYVLRAGSSDLRYVAEKRIDRWRPPDDPIVPLDPPPNARANGEVVGHWRWMDLAPDGNLALAQWSGECEIPIAFMVFVQEGRPIPVTGAATLGHAPASEAIGWTRNEHAVVILPEGACGIGAERPGVYRFSTPGAGSMIFTIDEPSAVVRMWAPRGSDATLVT